MPSAKPTRRRGSTHTGICSSPVSLHVRRRGGAAAGNTQSGGSSNHRMCFSSQTSREACVRSRMPHRPRAHRPLRARTANCSRCTSKAVDEPVTDWDELLGEQIAYYEARAPEYDQGWSREGRYNLGAEFNRAWLAEADRLHSVLDRF